MASVGETKDLKVEDCQPETPCSIPGCSGKLVRESYLACVGSHTEPMIGGNGMTGTVYDWKRRYSPIFCSECQVVYYRLAKP